MDWGNIIYIIAIIIYFIYQATSGKKKGKNPEIPDNQSREDQEKPVTFEDLLKEIRDIQEGKPKEEARPKPKPQTPPKRRESFEPIKAEKVPTSSYKPLEEQDDEIQYYKGAFEKLDPKSAKTSEGIPEIPSSSSDERFIKYRSQKKANPYSKLVKNKDSLKNAIVLKEILDRRHF